MFVVVMGVSGSGKSTVGAILADRVDAAFIDADDHHPAANVAKMAAGTPLQDADRWPWLDQVGEAAAELVSRGGAVVVACSALRRAHREVLRRHGATHFVHLTAEPDVLATRLSARAGHFMGPHLLASQLATLEPPGGEAAVLEIDVGAVGPADAAARADAWLADALS